MKRASLGLFLLFFTSLSSFGQKKQKIILEEHAVVDVDADLKEWQDLIDAGEGQWFYQLAQDQTNLYVAVQVVDPLLQNMAVRNGLLFGLVAEKKGKNDAQFLYPYPDSEVKRALKNQDFEAAKDYKQELIDRSRGYFLQGFPTVPDGLLSFQNNYGLKAVAKMKDAKLCYEAVIPKRLLRLSRPTSVFKIAINDGFSFASENRKEMNARPEGRYGYGEAQRRVSIKNKVTLAVVLEATVN